ncbi:MAG: glycosyltransferase [Candidatus Heimdallarchaeota archaeon]|nr:glycosyltransferase [Candidatus Heimdallarchaeota archaeon]MBY8994365.1 glycosyltransferase [Candidatus Heimdallarchaeota archaeon]
MQYLWLLILGIIYALLVVIALIYYISASVQKKDIISDSYLRSLPEEPFVSIIVPTYNEENNIVKCLKSLREQNYSNFEIILSDGGSQDRTVELAKPYADQIIIEKKVPEGWIGKNRGCHLGFTKAKGDILLFTDADTEHTPDSLRITVSMLLEKKVGLLSLLPYQNVKKWWESIVPINFFVSRLVSGGIARVNNPKKRYSFVAVGLYMMWTRKAYNQIGGHERLKNSIIEDYAFARLVKKNLQALYYMEGNKLVYASMYPDSVKHCWTGFKKCLYAGTKLTPPRRMIASLTFIFYGLLSPVAITLSAVYWVSYIPLVLTILAHLLLLVVFWTYWRGKGKHLWIIYVFFPIMMLMFLVTLLSSAIELALRKTTEWKGRIYKPNLQAGLNNNEEKSLDINAEDEKDSSKTKVKRIDTSKQTT